MRTDEEILSICTGLTIDNESAFAIHTQTENVLKALALVREDERLRMSSNSVNKEKIKVLFKKYMEPFNSDKVNESEYAVSEENFIQAFEEIYSHEVKPDSVVLPFGEEVTLEKIKEEFYYQFSSNDNFLHDNLDILADKTWRAISQYSSPPQTVKTKEVKSDAVEFQKWIDEKEYFKLVGCEDQWYVLNCSDEYTLVAESTEELYAIFFNPQSK